MAGDLPPGVEVFWEVDSGHHRLGTTPGEPTTEAVVALLDVIGTERFRGLLTFPGHAYGADNAETVSRIAKEAESALLDSAACLKERGIFVRCLSTGSTPTAAFARRLAETTELRPGAYVYADAKQVSLGSQTVEECALGS